MFSWVAIDRFAGKERARNATFRKQSADKVLRSDAQPLTDDELMAKLRSFLSFFLRSDSPFNSIRCALCTRRSRMLSASDGSPICACHCATGAWEVSTVERV